MFTLAFDFTVLFVIVGAAVLFAVVAVAAAGSVIVAANRRERLARHESLTGYYGHRFAFGH